MTLDSKIETSIPFYSEDLFPKAYHLWMTLAPERSINERSTEAEFGFRLSKSGLGDVAAQGEVSDLLNAGGMQYGPNFWVNLWLSPRFTRWMFNGPWSQAYSFDDPTFRLQIWNWEENRQRMKESVPFLDVSEFPYSDGETYDVTVRSKSLRPFSPNHRVNIVGWNSADNMPIYSPCLTDSDWPTRGEVSQNMDWRHNFVDSLLDPLMELASGVDVDTRIFRDREYFPLAPRKPLITTDAIFWHNYRNNLPDAN